MPQHQPIPKKRVEGNDKLLKVIATPTRSKLSKKKLTFFFIRDCVVGVRFVSIDTASQVQRTALFERYKIVGPQIDPVARNPRQKLINISSQDSQYTALLQMIRQVVQSTQWDPQSQTKKTNQHQSRLLAQTESIATAMSAWLAERLPMYSVPALIGSIS